MVMEGTADHKEHLRGKTTVDMAGTEAVAIKATVALEEEEEEIRATKPRPTAQAITAHNRVDPMAMVEDAVAATD